MHRKSITDCSTVQNSITLYSSRLYTQRTKNAFSAGYLYIYFTYYSAVGLTNMKKVSGGNQQEADFHKFLEDQVWQKKKIKKFCYLIW